MSKHTLDIVGQIDALRRYARVLTRNGTAADDLVQSTFLRAHERSSTFREGADLRVWLMSIMRNLYIDERRSALASEARERAWLGLRPGYSAASAEMATRLTELRTAFLKLPREQREALHLVAVEGFGIAEAAAILGVPAGTVMSRIGRARIALRTYEDSTGDGAGLRSLRIVGGRDDRSN